MDRIDKIIKATIKEVLLEKVDKRKDVLYHQTGFSVEKIRSILQNGLIPRDNGESNCIWFSVNKPFYNDPDRKSVV